MGEKVKKAGNTLAHRWRNAMPVFFRRVFWLCSMVSGMAIAINTAITSAGIIPHSWWQDICPYLIGIPAGMAFCAKFTQTYHGRPVDYDEHHRHEREGRTILDRDDN